MDTILKELDVIFQLVSSIPVSGNDVDVMAAARNKLRKVYTQLKEQEMENDG